MRPTAGAFARWSAVVGLWLLLAVLIPLTTLTHWMTGRGLSLAERAKGKLAEMRGQR